MVKRDTGSSGPSGLVVRPHVLVARNTVAVHTRVLLILMWNNSHVASMAAGLNGPNTLYVHQLAWAVPKYDRVFTRVAKQLLPR